MVVYGGGVFGCVEGCGGRVCFGWFVDEDQGA